MRCFFGVAIAYVYHFHRARFESMTGWRWPLMTSGVGTLSIAFIWPIETTPFVYTYGLTLFYIASGMILIGALCSKLPANRAVTAMAGVGAFSYSIYLWHMAVMRWVLPMIESMAGHPLSFYARTAIFIVMSIAAGIVMAKIVEIPALHIRDRYFPAKASDTAPTIPSTVLEASGTGSHSAI